MNLVSKSKVVILDNNFEYAKSLISKLKKTFLNTQFKIYTDAQEMFNDVSKTTNVSSIADSLEDIFNFDIESYDQLDEVYNHLINCDPALYILDYHLGDASPQNGIGVSRMLKKNKHHAYTILLTNLATYETGCSAQNNKYIDGFVAKDNLSDKAEAILSRDNISSDIEIHLKHSRSSLDYERLNFFNKIQDAGRELTNHFLNEIKMINYFFIDSLGSCYAKCNDCKYVFKVQKKLVYQELQKKYGMDFILFNENYDDIANGFYSELTYQNDYYVSGYKVIK